MAPFVTWVLQLPTISVYPSGIARATRPAAMVPSAPPTFSMMMGWPSDVRIPSPRTRAMMSVAAPAANGTIIVIGRDG
jgi:hypothetical protein